MRNRPPFRAWIAAPLALAATLTAAVELDPAALDRGSEIAYRRALVVAANDRRLNVDASAAARIRRIANRVVTVAGSIEPASKRYTWAVNVVGDPVPDLHVFPGGRLVVHQGLVARTALSDEELAAVVAHALAHALLGHVQRRIESRLQNATESPDPNQRALDAADATAETLRALRYTPAEIEAADRASVELLARAVYEPRAAGSAWRRLALADKGIVERSPVNDARLLALDAAARDAAALYEETRVKAEALATKPRPSSIQRGPPRPR